MPLNEADMGTQIASYLYKETRINFDSALPNSTVILRLPRPGTLVRSERSSKRPLASEVATSDDEKEYRTRHLASAASIYHRQHHKSPRSFLWRVLEDGKALNVSAIDLCKGENGSENPLTLRFCFGSSIRPGCVAFTDSKEHDVLTAYALTENNELYTLTLRPDFFKRRAATEDSTNDWCKIYVSSAFTFKHPHRLVAPTPDEVLITLHDGGLLRLARKPGHDASTWKDTFYNDGGWSSGFKSLVPWTGTNTKKYNGVNMELSAITAIETMKIGDTLCAFAVSLDHKLRIWEMAYGKAIYTGDILGQERKPEELGKWVISPSVSQLVRVIQDADNGPIVVTYSPHGAGEFKFWQTNGIPEGDVYLTDMFPESTLKPPPPTTDIWTMADFAIGKPVGSAATVSLWILWKNNITYRLQTCEFNLLSPSSIANAWAAPWSAAAGETLPDSPLPALTSTDPEDPSQKWLDYIMFPGRYTTATLETALSIYERSVGKAEKQTSRTTKDLVERMCSIVSKTAVLPMGADGELDFAMFKSATDAQWRRFYRLIIELDKQRGEALSLGFDHDEQLPVVATADGLSVIRDCSELERFWHNPDTTWGGRSDAVSRLLISAAAFRENFSTRLQHACDVQLKVELFQEPSLTDIERLQSFYDKCDFSTQIGDEDFTQLLANLGGSFKGVSFDIFERLVNSMTSSSDEMDLDGRLERLPLASFGRKVVVKGVQEMVELHRSICLDQLVLLAFIEGEIDQQEEGMRLDTAAVHRMLMGMLKRLEVLEWLASTEISIMPLKTERPNISDSFSSQATNIDSSPTSKKREDTKTITVLEGTLNHLLGLVAHSDIPATSLVTDLMLRVCDPNSDIELHPALIQAFLIKTERPDLAMSFSRFCSQDPFSTYIQGRACLASRDLSAGATYFKKAAFGLSRPETHASDRHSASLLNDTEWNLFHCGLPSYYSHIVALFDASKAHSYVIDFSRLALQFASPVTNAKPIHDAPKNQRHEEIRTDLLSRLFSAGLHTSRYELANSTLHLISDSALKGNYLRTLVNSMCESQAFGEMLQLPWLGLEDKVDSVLTQKASTVVDVNAGIPWHMILYSWRIRRGDFRGAASVAYERLQKLQVLHGQEEGTAKIGFRNGEYIRDEHRGRDELDTAITRQYLQVINALSCVEQEQAWIFVEPIAEKKAPGGGEGKRKVLKLEELRRALQEEMDRTEGLNRGRFPFGGDPMNPEKDVDMSG